MNDKIDFYLHKSNQFPTLPTIYTSLMQVMSNPRSSIKDLADVIIKDQASVVKLLRVVNSPIYGLQGKVTSVNQAILYLGFNEVKTILLALSVMDIYAKIKKSEKFDVVELWKHSITVGVISRIIAAKLQVQDTENYFIGGIIHDIGKLFFVHFFDEIYYKAIENSYNNEIHLTRSEEEIFGVNHCIIGAELAKKWNLPLQLKNVIEYHEQGKIDGKTDTLLACVHLANIIADLMKLGYSGDHIIRQPSFEIWNVINLPKGSFKDMYDNIIAGYQQANSILQIK
jgi:putative nucleotidyltransferase with HDIG domain